MTHQPSSRDDLIDETLDFWFRKYVDLTHQEDFVDSKDAAKTAINKDARRRLLDELEAGLPTSAESQFYYENRDGCDGFEEAIMQVHNLISKLKEAE